jgi:hypothetical protein
MTPDLIMPKLIPLSIKTKGKPPIEKFLAWVFSIRNWVVVEDWNFILPDGDKIVIPKNFRFDGASIPKPLWGILSPTGLLLVPGLIHDFGYRYDYIWAYDDNGNVYKKHIGAGQEFWDTLFYHVSNQINGIKEINYMAKLALSLFGGAAWKKNRNSDDDDIFPDAPVL